MDDGDVDDVGLEIHLRLAQTLNTAAPVSYAGWTADAGNATEEVGEICTSYPLLLWSMVCGGSTYLFVQ